MVFGTKRKRPGTKDLSVYVEIYDSVVERIYNTVSRSNVEEGGKFLGRIKEDGRKLWIKVESYIDSGPRVDHSASHIYPDGTYQEAMFRVVESFHPDIEHLGSWHSHHCNRLPNLSPGDVNGYIRSVNNSEYNLNYYFVLLVTELLRDGIGRRYYLFQRNHRDDYLELYEPENVRIVPASFSLESILHSAEQTTLLHKHESTAKTEPLISRTKRPPSETLNPLQQIRIRDKKWMSEKFPTAQLRQNRRDGSLYWRWLVKVSHGQLDIRYQYPSADSSSQLESSSLAISFENEIVISEDLPLDHSRFAKMLNFISIAESSIGNKAMKRKKTSDGNRKKRSFKDENNDT